MATSVMGPTGAGKSTFIQTATGHTDGVGHGLESCTSDVSAVRMNFPDGRDVVLVDTPGFDDTKLSDLEVLNIIAKWLKDARQDSLELSGILYLHRISDNRMAGTPLKNLGMFKKLCGDTFFERVILTTTMWPEIGDELKACESRERELRKEYWVDMIGRGSTTMRFENTPETAWNILNSIIDAEFGRRFDSAVLKIQEELVDQGKKLPKTEAGIQLHGFIEELVEKQNDILRRLREELGQAGDAVVVEALLTDLGQLRKQREQAMKDMRQLNPTLLGKLRRIFTLPPRARSSKPTVPLKSPGPASTNPGEQHGQTRSSESWDMPDTDGKPLPAGPSGAPGDQSPSMVDVVDNRNSRPPLDTPPETVSS
ncbi:hypothetical protein P691DRAFT_760434 [Macrolepiota fuliginosa MF-IS2]|uniref:G domain-containing protein n=1 Tax=Macrolepiota fuliginosa MF-IS2 TaxID=1400762 RepID=A0A9P6C0W9_9AGAR|nr:hypothetical protein P691DRAFT_760434 [Macrolepiota fuliginosa MF-IS2]